MWLRNQRGREGTNIAKIHNLDQAIVLATFLLCEHLRHQHDIEQIEKDLKKLSKDYQLIITYGHKTLTPTINNKPITDQWTEA